MSDVEAHSRDSYPRLSGGKHRVFKIHTMYQYAKLSCSCGEESGGTDVYFTP